MVDKQAAILGHLNTKIVHFILLQRVRPEVTVGCREAEEDKHIQALQTTTNNSEKVRSGGE